MTAPDFPDFTQSVGFVDKSAVLMDSVVLADGGVSGNVDTSQWQSVCVIIQPAPAGTNFNTNVIATWVEAGVEVAIDAVTCNTNSVDPNLPSIYYWQLPVQGSIMALNVFTQNPGGVTVSIVAYSRQVPAAKISYGASIYTSLLLDTGNVAVAAGGLSAAFHIPPTTHGYWITTNTALAKARTQLELASFAIGSGWQNNPTLNLTGDGSVNGQVAVPVGFDGGFIQFHNDDTVAHTWQCQVWRLA